jgi:hypothetical protein
MTLNEVSDCTYSGNTVSGYELGVSLYSQNFQTMDVKNNTVTGNVIHLCSGMATAIGIRIMTNDAAAVMKYNNIVGNVIYGDNTAGQYGILFSHVSGTLSDTMISSNITRSVPIALNFSTETSTHLFANRYDDCAVTHGGTPSSTTLRLEYNIAGAELRVEPPGDIRLTSLAANGTIRLLPTGSGIARVDDDNFYTYNPGTMAVDTGATYNLGGVYDNSGTITEFGKFSALKKNGISGDYAGYIILQTRINGGGFAERVRVQDSGELLSKNGIIVDNVAAPIVGANQVGFGANVSSTVGANGAASALTANPVGYLKINVSGTMYQVPYYNT